ncbi:MAG TPA: hypothetical protein VHN79_07835 [Lacunisphaera sp.]|nr:hypothetical protein [Lacunisphaera sp.]
MRLRISFSLSVLLLVSVLTTRAAAPTAAEAEQLRIIQAMVLELRARVDRLPVLLAPDQRVDEMANLTVTLNRYPVVVEGQRFDAVVVTAPATKASFAWAFPCPANVASWYIARVGGDMKGFGDFLRRPRAVAAGRADALAPTSVAQLTFQRLDSTAWLGGERYLLWFRFKDETPAEISFRAGFFTAPKLANAQLPALLFPPAPAGDVKSAP